MSILIELYDCYQNEVENEAEMKNRSNRYDINRHKARHGYIY